MKKEKFLEKLESLLEFNHKSKNFMYSHDLMVTSSEYFFDFSIANGGMRGSVLYGDILEVLLEEDLDKRLFIHIRFLAGDLYIPSSVFEIKIGATVHKIEQYKIVVLNKAEKENHHD